MKVLCSGDQGGGWSRVWGFSVQGSKVKSGRGFIMEMASHPEGLDHLELHPLGPLQRPLLFCHREPSLLGPVVSIRYTSFSVATFQPSSPNLVPVVAKMRNFAANRANNVCSCHVTFVPSASSYNPLIRSSSSTTTSTSNRNSF